MMINRKDWMVQVIGHFGESQEKKAIEEIGNYCYTLFLDEQINELNRELKIRQEEAKKNES